MDKPMNYTVLFRDSSDPVTHTGRMALVKDWVMFTTPAGTIYYPTAGVFRIKRSN